MMREVFKPLIYKNSVLSGYEISNFGNVKSLEREISFETTNQTGKKFFYKRIQPEKILKSKEDKGGYLTINIPIESGKIKTLKIHRLVAEAFIPKKENKFYINHIDENKKNNHVDNLEWVSQSENNAHGTRSEKFIAIKKYSLDGKLLGVYPTLREAGRSVERPNGKTGEGNRKSIKKCCDGELEQSMGYKWKYSKSTPQG
ncbi:HNH endonuclease signature motif containing protein [Lactococcus garvieae]|uniref:HNH endonuclease signature motif containing protein n=1 Tax=Lactococcus garvieae TaxID=1363 RepID=UPI00254CE2F4|nr:HNH endonuclease signature motif containing protein [Lactococcus garvieae]